MYQNTKDIGTKEQRILNGILIVGQIVIGILMFIAF